MASSRGSPRRSSASDVTRSVRSRSEEASADREAVSSSIGPACQCDRVSGRSRPPPILASVPDQILQRLDLRGVTGDLRGRLPRPAAQVEPPVEEVRTLLDDVRARGDVALRELTKRFDGAVIDDLRVPPAEVAAAVDAIDPAVRAALEVAKANITAYHEAQRHPDATHR